MTPSRLHPVLRAPSVPRMLGLLAAVVALALTAGCAAGSHRASARGVATSSAGAPTLTYAPASTPSGKLSCALRRRRFRTLPALKPVGVCFVRRRGAAVSPQDILVTPRPDPRANPGEQFGLMLYSADGKLLFYQRRPDKVHDFKVVRYHGAPALAYFQQHAGGGYYQLLDRHYAPIARIRTGHGYPTNLHELQVTPRGTAWISADVPVTIRGARVTQFVVQEVDIATGRVLFEWQSRRDVPPGDSYEERPHSGAWDYFHGNALSPPTVADPTVLVSSRNTSSLYGVDPHSGHVRWILGGKRDQFHLARHPAWRFCAQHDAHRLPNGDIILFDNGGTFMHGSPRCPVHPARALIFRVNVARRSVRLVREISSRSVSPGGKGYFSGYVGSAREETGGDTLIDWGPNRRVDEVGPNGRTDQLLRLQYWSYRATPADWIGNPAGAPAIAAQRGGGRVAVWASWNGATEIRRWQVLAGASPTALAPVGAPVAFADLETKMNAQTTAAFVAVRALGADGAALGQSRAIRPR